MTDFTLFPRLRSAFSRLFATALALLIIQTGKAETVVFEDTAYYVYHHDPAKEKLELWLSEGPGKPNTFPKVEARAKSAGRKLKFALNSGIFEGNFMPSGLHISEGKLITKINTKEFVKTREGEFTPNFFLKPNGIFFLHQSGVPGIMETGSFAKTKQEIPRLATQSGPLLVNNNTIHPILTKDSTSRRYRNGVGFTKEGKIFFACSVLDREIGLSNLYNFAALFRDKLKCPNALYLDGDLSYVFIDDETPPLKETNWFAGIFVVTEPAK